MRCRTQALASARGALLLLAGATCAGAGPPTVQLEGGKAAGVATAGAGAFFVGLPFAAPPVGLKGRWMPPRPLPPWTGTLDATDFKPACAQTNDWTGQPEPSIPGGGQGSEDCLYLDVYTPMLAPKEPLAVLLFVHGGGFTGGAGPTSSLCFYLACIVHFKFTYSSAVVIVAKPDTASAASVHRR
jgi:para-nitrobenzyl esterase